MGIPVDYWAVSVLKPSLIISLKSSLRKVFAKNSFTSAYQSIGEAVNRSIPIQGSGRGMIDGIYDGG